MSDRTERVHFLISSCSKKCIKIAQVSCSGYSETQERLQGITSASQTPAEETVRSRKDTASPADRGVCGKGLHCSLSSPTPWTHQEGHNPSTLLDCSFDAEKPQPGTSHLNVTEGPQSALPKSFSPCARAGGFRQGSIRNQGVGLGLGLGLGEKQEWEPLTGVGLQRSYQRKGEAAKILCNNWWRVQAQDTACSAGMTPNEYFKHCSTKQNAFFSLSFSVFSSLISASVFPFT